MYCLHLPVVMVGFVESSYTVSESEMSVMVCVEVKQGSLGITIRLLLSTDSDLSMYTVCTPDFLHNPFHFNTTDDTIVTLAPGNPEPECASIKITDDFIYEETESQTLYLSVPEGTNAVLVSQDSSTFTLFITDDDGESYLFFVCLSSHCIFNMQLLALKSMTL